MTQLQAISDQFIHSTKLELLNIVRDALLGETAADLIRAEQPAASAQPLRPLTKVIDRVGSLKRRTGEKRDPKVLAALTAKLGEYVKKNPGKRIEQIALGLGVPSKELFLPVKKLLHAGAIRTRGEKRATAYFAKAGK